VLVDEEGAYFIDREYLFNYIATPRELFLLQLKEGEAKESLLMGVLTLTWTYPQKSLLPQQSVEKNRSNKNYYPCLLQRKRCNLNSRFIVTRLVE